MVKEKDNMVKEKDNLMRELEKETERLKLKV